jgi:hypothetical protein
MPTSLLWCIMIIQSKTVMVHYKPDSNLWRKNYRKVALINDPPSLTKRRGIVIVMIWQPVYGVGSA